MTPAEFERETGLIGSAAAALLRVSRSKWYEWRDGTRALPAYIEASMIAHAAAIRAGLIQAGPGPQPGSARRRSRHRS